jgi:uncharacterized protein (DUF983 family)
MKNITINELLRRFWAVLWLRCSHCLRGPVYEGVFQMYERCPVCGIQYEREHGFFLMAIVFGYFFYLAVLMPLSIWLYRMRVPMLSFVIVITVVSIVLIPPVFHYARVIWLHIDEVLDPRA